MTAGKRASPRCRQRIGRSIGIEVHQIGRMISGQQVYTLSTPLCSSMWGESAV